MKGVHKYHIEDRVDEPGFCTQSNDTTESSQDQWMMPEERYLNEGLTLIACNVELQGLQGREGGVT